MNVQLTVIVLLTVLAFAICIMSAIGRAPLWVSVLLLTLIHLLSVLPLGRT